MINSLATFRALRLSAAISSWLNFESMVSNLDLEDWEERLLREGLRAMIDGPRGEQRYYNEMMTTYATERQRRQQTTPPASTGLTTPPPTVASFVVSSGTHGDSDNDSVSTFGDELDTFAGLSDEEIKSEQRAPTPMPTTPPQEDSKSDDVKEEPTPPPSPPMTRSAARKRGRDAEEIGIADPMEPLVPIKPEPKRQRQEAKDAESGGAVDHA